VINIWLIVLCAYGQSIFVFIIYGLRSDVYEQWHTAIVTRSLKPAEKQTGANVRPTVRTTVGSSKHKMFMNKGGESAADKQAAAMLSAIMADMEKQDEKNNNGEKNNSDLQINSPMGSHSQLPTPTSPETPETAALFKGDQN
jgi:hypothetical protein